MAKAPLVAIIDDDAAALAAIVSLVKAMEFAAEGFGSAGEFMASSVRLQADCLITDMRMPGMNGLDLYLHMAASGIPIPTILATAYPDDATRERALRAGVRCYLPKPIRSEELLLCLRRALNLA